MDKENVSLIVIGTELTEGIIQDKHGQLVSREVSRLGYHMKEIVAIPDDGTIERVLGALVRNNDIIIVTGGLGPTSDDMTRTALADIANVPLEKRDDCYERLYKRVGERIHGANEKQAYIPRGFTPMLNPNGTAEGFYGYAGDVLIIALPGPPREMEPMFHDYVIPYLSSLSGHHMSAREEYTTFLIPEAKLEELTEEADSSLLWGTRFQDYRISLYVSGGDEAQLDAAIGRLREWCGPELILKGDHTALCDLRALLLSNGLMLSGAESCTGGLASVLLTDLPGSSECFLGSIVSYSNSAKEQLLGVKEETIRCHGAVSCECALEMAEGAMKAFSSDCAYSITGVAGPGESEQKKVGTVCFGFAAKGRESQAVCVHLSTYGRASARSKSSTVALLLMKAYLEGRDTVDIVSKWRYI